MSEKILDIEKIGEKGKIELSQLKLILKEMLEEVKVESQRNDDFKIDISIMLGLLFDKGIISKEEYEDLKDKVNSVVGDNSAVDDAIKDNELTDDAKEEIIRRSSFKGFYPSYEALINALPIDKCKHGDFAYVKDFEAGRYDINDISEFIYDVKYAKWMLGTDETLLRNYRPRYDINPNGEPCNKDIIMYNDVVKRWFAVSLQEADVARESVLMDHLTERVLVEVDDSSTNSQYVKNDGRIMVQTNENSKPPRHTSHISNLDVKRVIKQIDDDYHKTIGVEYYTDELGVERIRVDENDEDSYGNDINKNITNKTLRAIIDKLYENLDRTFNIEIDEETGRILNVDLGIPEEYITRMIRTYDVDKIISRVNDDYNNSYEEKDFQEDTYGELLNVVLSEFFDRLNIPQEDVEGIIERLNNLNVDKTITNLKPDYNIHEKNKNISYDIMKDLIKRLIFLQISNDIFRDEIMERDNIINGNKNFTGNIDISGIVKYLKVNSRNVIFDNAFGETAIGHKAVTFNNIFGETLNNHKTISHLNEAGTTTNNHVNITVSNEESVMDIKSKKINISNPESVMNVAGISRFVGDAHFFGNMYIADSSNIVEVNAEKVTYKDNILELNNGEKGAGVTYNKSGFLIDRGQLDDYFIGFDELRDEFVSGFVEDESDNSIMKINPLLHRDNTWSLSDSKPFVWNETDKKAVTSDNIEVDISGCINFKVTVPNHTFKVLDLVRFSNNVLVLSSCDSLDESVVIGMISKIVGDDIYICTSGIVPIKIEGLDDGTVLFLQPDGRPGVDSSHLISKEVGIQLENGILINIQRSTAVSNSYTSYQLSEGLKKFDAVIMDDFGILSKASSETIETAEVFGIVSKVTPYSVQVVTSGFIEGDIISPIGSTLFLQHDGTINNHKESNVEKAVATKVNLGIYVDIKLGIKKIGKVGDVDLTPKDILNDSMFELDSDRDFEVGEILSLNENGEFVKFTESKTKPIGMVVTVYPNEKNKNKYMISTSSVISYSLVSLKTLSNKYCVSFMKGDTLFYGSIFSTIAGEYTIGHFSEIGFTFDFSKKPAAQLLSNLSEEQIAKKIERKKYYRIQTKSLSFNTIELFQMDTDNFAKIELVNNSGLKINNIFAKLISGNYIAKVFKHNGNFILSVNSDTIIKTNLELNETEYNEDFISLNI